jgi:hypothetical protein
MNIRLYKNNRRIAVFDVNEYDFDIDNSGAFILARRGINKRGSCGFAAGQWDYFDIDSDD